MAGVTATSHNSAGNATVAEEGLIDRFLAWLRGLFDDNGDETAPPPSGSPPPVEGGAVDCNRLQHYISAYGAAGGRALFAREIQHEGGRQGFRNGGWMGAIIGGIQGTGQGANAIRQCEEQMGPALADAGDDRREGRRLIREERRSCKDECDATYSNHNLITANGRQWRECRRGCNHEARDARRAQRDGGPTAAGMWARTFLP